MSCCALGRSPTPLERYAETLPACDHVDLEVPCRNFLGFSSTRCRACRGPYGRARQWLCGSSAGTYPTQTVLVSSEHVPIRPPPQPEMTQIPKALIRGLLEHLQLPSHSSQTSERSPRASESECRSLYSLQALQRF